MGVWCVQIYHSKVGKTNDHSFLYHLDLPNLQSISLEWGAFQGNPRDEYKTIPQEPFNYRQSLTMEGRTNRNQITNILDLPLLREMKLTAFNFFLIGKVVLKSTFWQRNDDLSRYSFTGLWEDWVWRY